MNLRRDDKGTPDFMGGFLEWLGTDDGEVSFEAINSVAEALEGADIDLDERRIVWRDGSRLNIDETAERIHSQSGIDLEALKFHVVSWLEMDFVPKDLDEKQMDAFEARIDDWIKAYDGGQ